MGQDGGGERGGPPARRGEPSWPSPGCRATLALVGSSVVTTRLPRERRVKHRGPGGRKMEAVAAWSAARGWGGGNQTILAGNGVFFAEKGKLQAGSLRIQQQSAGVPCPPSAWWRTQSPSALRRCESLLWGWRLFMSLTPRAGGTGQSSTRSSLGRCPCSGDAEPFRSGAVPHWKRAFSLVSAHQPFEHQFCTDCWISKNFL